MGASARIGLQLPRMAPTSRRRGMSNIDEAFGNGMVLVMSIWDDHYANMLWLDSTYPTDSTDPGAARGTCATSSGVPAQIEQQHADANVQWSNIRYGPIGSTTNVGTITV